MKPNFALTLSFEGIGLLHRAFPGWHLVGEVALDSADLTAQLRALRAKATALDSAGLRCKLVIPNDQIKYLSVPAEADTDPAQTALAALEGATPYAVADLAHDWSRSGDTIQVAAVARETLDEAEAFALEHDFAPVSFVATPAAGDFTGEPFFGMTRAAARLLPEGASVIRDTAPIRIIGASKLPEPAPVPEAESQPDTETDSAPGPETTAKPDAATPDAGKAEVPGTVPAATAPAVTEAAKDTHADSSAEPVFTPAAAEAAPGDAKPDTPADTPKPAAPAFTSIRASRGEGLPATAPRLDSATRLKGLRLPEPGEAMRPAAPLVDPLPDRIARTGASLLPEPDPDPAAPPVAVTDKRRAGLLGKRKPSVTPAPDKAPDPKAARESERQRMTVFGAREAPVGGKPRFLGLILVALLLLFLVGVAAWSSAFLDEGLSRFFGTPERIQVSDVPAVPEPEGEPEIAAVPALAPQIPSPEAETGEAAPQTGDATETAALADLPQAEPEPDPAPQVAEVPTEEAALSSYAASGIWQMAPEPPAMPAGPSEVGDLFEAALDPDVSIPDAMALPGAPVNSTDSRLPTPANPPDAETRFVLDARGLVKATEDGALTQDGVPVFAGEPPLVPPEVPRRAVVAPEDPALVAEVARLAAVRPKTRPDLPETDAEAPAADAATDAPADDGAAAEGDAAGTEIAALDTETTGADATDSVTQTPSLRPRLRPENLAPAAATQAGLAVDADAVAAAIADAAEVTVDEAAFENPTAQAVAASPVPRQRPKGFAALIEKMRTPEPRNEALPEDDGEPEVVVASASPNLPSSASVAKEATERNAINLREVNLIGVYGPPNSRRALVRLSNGRYKKVQVGDKLDGGQVAAIGDTELRYVKRGKAVLLRMPKG